jgi:hypothetical protein
VRPYYRSNAKLIHLLPIRPIPVSEGCWWAAAWAPVTATPGPVRHGAQRRNKLRIVTCGVSGARSLTRSFRHARTRLLPVLA